MTVEDPRTKIIPINAEVARELTNYVEKSWDMANNGDNTTNELWSTELQAFLDAHTLKSLFFSEDWVFIVVDLMANKISSQPMRVMQRSVNEDGTETVEPVPQHPLNELLRQPNEWQDYAQWMYNTCVEFYLMGNAIIWQAKRSGQLITMPTENIRMDFDPDATVKSYTVTNVRKDGSGLGDLQNVQTIPAKEIIHIRRPNPCSLLWGLSGFIPGRKSVLFNRYSSDYLNAFYLKQATPGLALSLEKTVNEDVALRQLRSFEVAYQGRKNMRRTLILPKGVDVKPLTHSLSDQKLIEHIELNRETICGLFKIPKHELSLQSAGSLGSEEHKMALRNFWESTLLPGMDQIAGAVTKAFQGQLEEGQFLAFDTSDVEALRDDLKKKAEIATQMLQAGLSINEVRSQVWEQDPVEDLGADDPFVLVQQRASALTVTREAAPGDEVGTDQEETEAQRSLPAAGRTKIHISEKVESLRRSRKKQLDQEEGRTIGELSQLSIDILVGMTRRALEVIEKSDKALSVKDLPSAKVLRARIRRALERDFEETWINNHARVLSTSVELGYDQNLELVFNAEAQREIQALRERDEEGRRLSLQARGLDSFASISESHTERIMKQIQEGQRRNESITDIMRRVATTLGTPGQLAGRAETIARTETLTAVSLGQGAAIDNAKEVIPGLKKAWLTAGDDRVRDSHQELDGDVVDVDKKFDNGLRYPRDVKSQDASEVINCRCTMLLLPPDEDLEI